MSVSQGIVVLTQFDGCNGCTFGMECVGIVVNFDLHARGKQITKVVRHLDLSVVTVLLGEVSVVVNLHQCGGV